MGPPLIRSATMQDNPSDLDVIDSLYRISSLVNNTEEPREALELIIDEIMRVLPAQAAAIELINPDTGMLQIEVLRGMPRGSAATQLRPGEGVTGWVALHGRPLYVPDVDRDPRYIEIAPGIRSEIAVPMIGDEGNVIGVVNIDSARVDAFDERACKILTLLTNEATRVVTRIWLIKKLREKAGQLESLVAAGRSLVRKRELQDLLDSITTETRALMRCRICALFLLDPQREHLALRSIAGAPDGFQATERLALGDSAIGTALRRNKTIEIRDLPLTEEHHFVHLIRDQNLVSLLATPIVCDDEVIGVLNAYTDRPHRFSNEERRFLETLAGIGAIAIQNARLYARIFQTEENIRRTEKLTTLGLLSAEIAHEIRNPLTVIRLLFESLDLDFPADDVRARDMQIISEKLDQLEAIVSRVLNFGKSKEELRAPFDMREIIRDTLHLVRLKLQQSRIDVAFEAAPDTAFIIDVNKGQIQQALLNLIINATQAMPAGGKICLHLDARERDGVRVLAIEIEDTGRGVPDAIRDRIFDSFLSGNKEGTGLGLAIVKRILNSHGGDAELVRSSPAGTVIRIWLPFEAPRAPQ